MAYGEKCRARSVRRRSQLSTPVRLAVAVVLGASIAFAGTASAQVPPTPAPPAIPEPVDEALEDLAITLIPVLNEAVAAADPGANAVGFASRPACATVGLAFYAGALTGVVVPYPSAMGYYLSPVSLFCLAATSPGPADAVFEEADAAAGPALSEQLNPVFDRAAGTVVPQLAPIRGELGEACANYALTDPIVQQLPPTLQRLRPVAIVCSKA